MCENPITIKVPYSSSKDLQKRFDEVSDKFHKKHLDCGYMAVPCGKCKECRSNKQMQLIQRVQQQNKGYHAFMVTLTYNPESLPIYTTKTGHKIAYADIKDIQDLMRRLRHYNILERRFKYMAVSERGSVKGRPHFHLMLFLEAYESDTFSDILQIESKCYHRILANWKTNHGTRKNPIYTQNLTLSKKWIRGELKSNYDCHYIRSIDGNSGSDDVAFYVSKYIMKVNEKEEKLYKAIKINYPPEEAREILKCVKSRAVKSLEFGEPKRESTKKEIIKNLERDAKNGEEYPKYYTDSGQSFPLAQYYRKKYMNEELLDKFWYNNKNHREDANNDFNEEEHKSQLVEKSRAGKEIIKKVTARTDLMDEWDDNKYGYSIPEIPEETPEEFDKTVFEGYNFENESKLY